MAEFEPSDYCRRCGRVRAEHVLQQLTLGVVSLLCCPGHAEPMADVHQARHAQLHAMLDELVADWMIHTGKRPSTTSVLALMEWANEQRLAPTATPKR